MSTELRNVPGTGNAQNQLTQTRFWGGKNKLTCLQVSQKRTDRAGPADQFFNNLQLTKAQAGALAVELMLFAEGREVEESEEVIHGECDCYGCTTMRHPCMHDSANQGLTERYIGAILYITIRAKGKQHETY